jgi:outer membrane protein TolC
VGTRNGSVRMAAAYQGEQLRAARLRLISETITQVLRLASVRAQIEVVNRVVDADEKTLELVQAARKVGVVSDIDVQTATAQRDRDRVLLPPLYQAADAARDALAILVGQAPANWAPPEFSLDQFTAPQESSY